MSFGPGMDEGKLFTLNAPDLAFTREKTAALFAADRQELDNAELDKLESENGMALKLAMMNRKNAVYAQASVPRNLHVIFAGKVRSEALINRSCIWIEQKLGNLQ